MTHLQFFAIGKGWRDPAFHSFNLGKMDVVDPWNTAPGAGKGLVVEVPIVTYRWGWAGVQHEVQWQGEGGEELKMRW